MEIHSYNKVCHYEGNELHREDGPAMELKDGTKHWFIKGQRHREDGPAVIFSETYMKKYPWIQAKRYFLFDKELTEDEFIEFVISKRSSKIESL